MTTLGGFHPFYFSIPGAGGSTPVFVGSTIFTSSIGAGGSVAVNITSGIPSGAIIFVTAGGGTTAGSQQATSITDGINSYSKALGIGTTTSVGTSMWYTQAQTTTAVPAGNTISANWGSFAPTQGFVSVMYSPSLLASSLDRAVGNGSFSGTTVTVTSTPLAQSSELILGVTFCKSTSTSIITESSGYTTIDSNNTGFGTSSCSYNWGYLIVSSTSSVGYTPTFSTSVTASTCIIGTFK